MSEVKVNVSDFNFSVCYNVKGGFGLKWTS